jgi:Zn-dependent oligopeptidase
MRKSPEGQFLDQCREGLTRARASRAELLAAPHGVAETLDLYNRILVGAGNSGNLAGLMAEVHPDDGIRDAARTVEQEVSTFVSELHLDGALYRALAALELGADVDDETRRFVEHTLRDFRRAGVDRDDATRERLKVIDEELTKLGQLFSKNLAEDVRTITAAPQRLAGLPQDWIDAHPPSPDDGLVRITTDYPDYNPFMAYAEDDDLRRQLYIQNRSRGGDGNERLLHDILILRAEKARLLGYTSWADYVTEDKMIKSAARAGEFIDRVWELARARARRDYDELLGELREHVPGAAAVADWQKVWLETQVKKKKYRVDAEKVREYFPYDEVLAGLLDITATIYELQYVPARGVDVWHPDVRVFDVVRAGARLGRIYLDMHPRDGKYKHAAQFNLRDGTIGAAAEGVGGVAGGQLPEGVLVCNFPRPSSGGDGQNPGLLEHDDVVTMFHEFGHLMHHVVGGHHRWVRQSGVATEMDFVEAPSQMFEEWAWSWDTLARFARHYKTGEVIPRELVADMRRADKLGIGTQTVQQMFYAALSLGFHIADPATLDQLDELKRLQAKYTPFAYVPGTRFHAGFGHLVGYSAMYYTYMWSLVIAKDMLSAFAGGHLMDTATTRRYRDAVLAAGGTKDAAELVREFLGREYRFDAFEQYLAE